MEPNERPDDKTWRADYEQFAFGREFGLEEIPGYLTYIHRKLRGKFPERPYHLRDPRPSRRGR